MLNRAERAARRRSQAQAQPSAAPAQAPLMAAIVTAGISCSSTGARKSAGSSGASAAPDATAWRSAPGQKLVPAPVSTRTLTDRSSAAWASASPTSRTIRLLMALRRSGRFMVSVTTGPSCS